MLIVFNDTLGSQLNRAVDAVVVLQMQREQDLKYIEELKSELKGAGKSSKRNFSISVPAASDDFVPTPKLSQKSPKDDRHEKEKEKKSRKFFGMKFQRKNKDYPNKHES